MHPTVQAQPFWAQLPVSDRARYLRHAAQVLLDVGDEVARALAPAHGRTEPEAWALDVLPGVEALHWAAAAGPRALAPQRVRPATPLQRGRRTDLVREPLGLVGVRASDRSPWAGPLARCAAALVAGNGVLLPASPTTERIARLFERVGVPEGIVATAGDDELDALCALVFDDGAAGLEDPGPMVILADADLDRAAGAAVWAARAAGGRMPRGVSAVFADESVGDRLEERIAARAAHFDGGNRGEPGVAPVTRCAGEQDAVERAAELGGGGASIWTEDAWRAECAARALRAPVVWINDHGDPLAGRSEEDLHAATRAVVRLGGPSGLSPFLRRPADRDLADALRSVGTVVFGRDSDRMGAARDGVRPLSRTIRRALKS